MDAEKIIESLRKRGFEAVYAADKKEAVEKALSYIPEGSSVSWGGSVSIEESGLLDKIRAGNYKVIDRSLGKTPEEKTELMRKGLLADTFLTSFNALSEDGVVFNIDGNGNRVAAIAFGPSSVVALVGINKIVKSEKDLEERALKVAAPKNARRLQLSDEKDICAIFVRTRICRVKGRIKIILVGEELGY
ncbi:MAG: lactate utilization protein [Treponema sp.]|nr:lactate utilization protein [Treponema sp.]